MEDDVARALRARGPGALPENAGGGGVLPKNSRGPYQKAPDSLMGFRRRGPNKPFEETNYKHTQWVEVTQPDGSKHIDAMNGLNQKHAIERAYRNWDGAQIRALSKEEALLIDPSLREMFPGEFGELEGAIRALGGKLP